MVDAHDVGELQAPPQPLDPPPKTVLRHQIPTVERVSPQLAGFAEVVRWHAGLGEESAVTVEPELLLVEPDVGGIVIDVDRQIPQYAQPFEIGVRPKR